MELVAALACLVASCKLFNVWWVSFEGLSWGRGGKQHAGMWVPAPGAASPPRSRSVPSTRPSSPAAPCNRVSWPGRWTLARHSRRRSAGRWRRSWACRRSWPAVGEAESPGSRRGASCWGRRERSGGLGEPARSRRQEVAAHRLSSSRDSPSSPQTHCSSSSLSPREDGEMREWGVTCSQNWKVSVKRKQQRADVPCRAVRFAWHR